ncbi:DUF7475 family protein [Halorhabdus amylolytica]|uniref:DUF7475 family protein n=1 Tax=Halorhabdus amylolytica TaxID=2559573 RepID=UPI0010A9D6A7|nr:hypothetical protein [Halorhabdus amylolytica]
MSGRQSGSNDYPLLTLPSHPVGYVAIGSALLTGVIHLFLGQNVFAFSQTMGALFVLNGLGFLGGVGLYLSHYWRQELYIVAAGYALITVLAFFLLRGFSLDAFYVRGALDSIAVVSKVAEGVLAVAVLSLFAQESSAESVN